MPAEKRTISAFEAPGKPLLAWPAGAMLPMAADGAAGGPRSSEQPTVPKRHWGERLTWRFGVCML